MKSTKQKTANHLSLEETALFDEFMDEQALPSTFSNMKDGTDNVSLELLLAVLNDAKKIINTLNSYAASNKPGEDINSRLTHIETELSALKLKITNL